MLAVCGCGGAAAKHPDAGGVTIDAPPGIDGAGLCQGPPEAMPTPPVDYRAEMIAFVKRLAVYATCRRAGFGIIPQNAAELGADSSYVAAVVGIGQEDLHYGYGADGVMTPAAVTAATEANLDVFVAGGRKVLVVDYPFDEPTTPAFSMAELTRVGDAYAASAARQYVPYATVRDLSTLVVTPGHAPAANPTAISSFGAVTDWGYRLQPSAGQARAAYLAEMASQPWDLLVTDYSYDGSGAARLTAAEVSQIRAGTKGLVVAYLSIGEAENYRDYWMTAWDANGDGMPDAGAPSWLGPENPDWPGNYKVRYWDPAWERLIYGSPSAYLDQIIDAGFDGAYLDIIDAYECFQSGACPP